METTKTVAVVNGTKIQVIENGEKLVPIRPICDALGIAHQPQIEKINSDEFLSSTVMLSMTVGADGKEREMLTIPYKYIFGWLFTINPKNVNPEAKESVLKYRMECYEVLYNHFTETSRFLDEKQQLLNVELDKLKQLKQDFKATKELLNDQNKKVDGIRHQSFEEWKANNRQMKIDFSQ